MSTPSPKPFEEYLNEETQALRETGLYKHEYIISSPQRADITVANDSNHELINFCANNYLGLANHPQIIAAAKEALDIYGYGMASVRFICGTQSPHQKLEERLSQFFGTEDTITYSSCYAANVGLFEPLLTAEDAIISDSLNHACIIDGIRLSKAQRFLYPNSNMEALEEQLKQAKTKGCRYKVIATDGVFSMDGYIAKLDQITTLAQKYGAWVMVDDSHGVGVIGDKGKGSPSFCGVADKIDLLSGTLGKALGGSAGGYITGKKEVITWLRQRSRTYLFSNSLPPAIGYASIKAIDLIESGDTLRQKLQENATLFRTEMENMGYELLPGNHPIIPVMVGDAKRATEMAKKLFDQGIYVIGFSFPVVPKEEARIRVQISAGHSRAHIDKALQAFSYLL